MAVNVLAHHGGLLTEFGVALNNFMLVQGFHCALCSSHLPFKSLLLPVYLKCAALLQTM